MSFNSEGFQALERLIELYLRKTIDSQTLCNAQHAYLKSKSVKRAVTVVVN